MASGLLLAPSGDALKITRKRKSASLWSQSPTTDTDDLYLPQEELHKYLPLLRQRAIEYLSELVNSEQENNRHDPFLWGDEVEYVMVHRDSRRRRATLYFDIDPVWKQLQALQSTGLSPCEFQKESCRCQLETAPRVPRTGDLVDLNNVEHDLINRRRVINGILQTSQLGSVKVYTAAVYPRLYCRGFSMPSPGGIRVDSAAMTRWIATPYPRCTFGNARYQRHVKVTSSVSVPAITSGMQDNTITFPKGCLPYCGLQLTIQCPDLKEACWLHDQLLVIAPYMLALTAASPVQKGRLTALDSRWTAWQQALDDRQQASEYPRWGCFPGFLSPEGACFNDVTPTADLLTLKDMIQDMKRRGVSATLARYLCLYMDREPLCIHRDDLDKITSGDGRTAWQLFLKSRWPTVKLKLPDKSCDWNKTDSKFNKVNSGRGGGGCDCKECGSNIMDIGYNRVNNGYHRVDCGCNRMDSVCGRVCSSHRRYDSDCSKVYSGCDRVDFSHKRMNCDCHILDRGCGSIDCRPGHVRNDCECNRRHFNCYKVDLERNGFNYGDTEMHFAHNRIDCDGKRANCDHKNVPCVRKETNCDRNKVNCDSNKAECDSNRLEFRPMEVQPTSYENSAFLVFMSLLARMLMCDKLNLYMPLSQITENMQSAVGRDAAVKAKLHFSFCKDDVRWNEEMTLNEIFNGKADYWAGIVPLVRQYVEQKIVPLDTADVTKVMGYLDFVSKRASGEIRTVANWTRNFVENHAHYQNDGHVTEEITYDLFNALEQRQDHIQQ